MAVTKAKQAKRVMLNTDFAGIRAGAMLYVATPEIVARYINGIPAGEVRDIIRLRRDLARQNKADATCPVSTAIFLRQIAEKSLADMQAGATPSAVVPFWRVIEPGSKIAKRLSCDDDWIGHQRRLEAADGEAAGD